MIKTLFYSHVRDLWGGGREAGGVFSSLVFRGAAAEDCCHLCISGLLWDLPAPKIFVLELEGPGGGGDPGDRRVTSGHPVSRTGVQLVPDPEGTAWKRGSVLLGTVGVPGGICPLCPQPASLTSPLL